MIKSIAVNPSGAAKRTPKYITLTHTVDVLAPGEPLRINSVSRHPRLGFVYIEAGALLRDGRVSNHWTFRRVDMEKGIILPAKHSDYGWV